MYNPQPKPTKKKKSYKQKEWYTVMHNEILPQFEKWGITSCEIKLDRCVQTMYLGFAHTKKRKDIYTSDDLRRVVLACQSCHEVVEYHCMENTGKTMTDYLENIIQIRELKLKKLGIYI